MLMLLFLALSRGLAGIVFDRYTLPYAPEGIYYDAENVVAYQEQSVLGWGSLLAISLLLTAVCAYFAFSRRRKGTLLP
ncbi:hypothetical protein ADICEAN_01770 [Cesiribacter andamanensis AMV16]|uniref:Uncharacterized protein n=2 Tax=Cesiribacter TaxID=1133570 RepID=M7N793_9BACT|nr:hypothetical protein ADICEAN_01770 [Cesiribacter andamanensis AMV16]